jgi:copper chaperone CopZ
MLKSEYRISKMDCPSEENMIRVKLEGLPGIQKLEFNIDSRQFLVYHSGGVILAGILVLLTQSRYPDLIVGSMVFIIVIRGAIRMIQLGK